MGIIILPFIFVALFLAAASISKLITHFKNKNVGIKEILLGLLVSAVLFGLICLSYILEGSAWALSPAFRVPIFMVFVPFLMHIFLENFSNPKLTQVSIILLVRMNITCQLNGVVPEGSNISNFSCSSFLSLIMSLLSAVSFTVIVMPSSLK